MVLCSCAKQNKGNTSITYLGDFSDVDMTGWGDVYEISELSMKPTSHLTNGVCKYGKDGVKSWLQDHGYTDRQQ